MGNHPSSQKNKATERAMKGLGITDLNRHWIYNIASYIQCLY